MATRLPPAAAAAIDRYLDAVDTAVPGLVVGLHVCGSLALGDYQGERSDIDVVAIVGTEPDGAQRRLLAEVHRVVASRLDGPYLTAEALAKPPDAAGPVAYHVDGRFEHGECYEANPVTWAILAERAVTVRGDAPAALGCTADDEAVRAFSAANLASYWASWARTIASLIERTADDEMLEARMVQWGVLGAARVHCAATTGRILSKCEAGQYALDTFDAQWHDLVDVALLSRAGEIDETSVGNLRRTTEFVGRLSDAEFAPDKRP